MIFTNGIKMSKAKGEQWGGHCHTATAELSGIRGPISYLSMSRQKICTGIMLKLQQRPIQLQLPKKWVWSMKGPCPRSVLQRSLQTHFWENCNPGLQYYHTESRLKCLCLSPVFTYMFAQWQIKMSRILSDRSKCNFERKTLVSTVLWLLWDRKKKKLGVQLILFFKDGHSALR